LFSGHPARLHALTGGPQATPLTPSSGASCCRHHLNWPCLGSWTTADLDEYLLDYFPRKVCADDELVRDAPACVVAFLTMLNDHDALDGATFRSLG